MNEEDDSMLVKFGFQVRRERKNSGDQINKLRRSLLQQKEVTAEEEARNRVLTEEKEKLESSIRQKDRALVRLSKELEVAKKKAGMPFLGHSWQEK